MDSADSSSYVTVGITRAALLRSVQNTRTIFSEANPFLPQNLIAASKMNGSGSGNSSSSISSSSISSSSGGNGAISKGGEKDVKRLLKEAAYEKSVPKKSAAGASLNIQSSLSSNSSSNSNSNNSNSSSNSNNSGINNDQQMVVSNKTSAAAKDQKYVQPSLAVDVYYQGKNKHLAAVPVPEWHAPWQLSTVISGHLGWVRCIAFDPSNEWFVTGSEDRTIKVWDLAKCCTGTEGGLRITLPHHIFGVRGLVVSPRHPYLFSVGDDKKVLCWDLEHNRVVRHYHGHLSGVVSVALHPTLDVLISGGRDSVARVWDIRTKHEVHMLSGHSNTVSAILANSVDPQVITGSHDNSIRLWDLAAGKSMGVLNQHKKPINALAMHPKEFSFLSGAADNVKKWQARDGSFLKNFSGHSEVNAVAINEDGVAVSCANNGTMNFWDYQTGYCFQNTKTIPQPGSLDAEAGIYAAAFDLSGSRLITCEADKSIKIWKESDDATEITHPVDMEGWTKQCLKLKKY